MSEPAPDELTLDAQPEATYSDFYDELGPKSAIEKAALIWRMPKAASLVICENK